MNRVRWVLAFLLLASVVAEARRPVKVKPRNAKYLAGTKLWYMVQVPEPYDPREKYPLVVVAPYREDYADASFRMWQQFAQEDRVFLAALNFSLVSKEKEEERVLSLIRVLKRQYPTIDLKRLAFVGVEGGGGAIMRFAATYPAVFAAAVSIAPRSFPAAEGKPRGPRLAASKTRLHVTVDPRNRDLRKKLNDCLGAYKKAGLRPKVHLAEPMGLGKPSEEEEQIALAAIRTVYSEDKQKEKRRELAALSRKAAEEARRKREAERKEAALARKDPDGEKPPPKGEPAAAQDPDDVLEKAREARERKLYTTALKLFRQLAKLAPGTDYARVAQTSIKEIEEDPAIRRAMADEEAGARGRSWLRFARSFAKSGKKAEAVAQYKRIIEKYPDSSFAETAREELKELGGK